VRWLTLTVAGALALGAGAPLASALPTGWSPGATLSGPGVVALEPAAAVNARGDAVVAWRALLPGGRERVQLAVHRAGSAGWERPLPIGGRARSIQGLRVALSAGGRILVGWRGRTASASTAWVTTLRTTAPTRRTTALGPSEPGSGPVSVALGAGGLAGAAYVTGRATGAPRAPRAGRTRLALTSRRGITWLVHRLDPGERAGHDGGGPTLVPAEGGGLLATWDAGGGGRLVAGRARAISPAGRLGRIEDAARSGRAASGARLATGAGGGAVAIWGDGRGGRTATGVGISTRAPNGAWTALASLPDRSVTALAPPPAIAARGDEVLGTWSDPDGLVRALTGPTTQGPFRFRVLQPFGLGTRIAGAGFGAGGDRIVAWTAAAAPSGPSRKLFVSVEPAAGTAFGAPTTALLIPDLVGDASLLTADRGTGILAYVAGPRARARVRANLIGLP
jgi:hypothetical protein